MNYAKYISETAINRNPPRRAIIDGREVTGKLPAAYLASLGFLPLEVAPYPEEEPREGYHYAARYAEGEGVVLQSWAEVENAKPRPREFSKLKCVAALMEAGVWSNVKSYIEGAGLYDLYLAAQDFKEDNPYFVSGKAQLQTALGWTDEQVEAILSQCVSEV